MPSFFLFLSGFSALVYQVLWTRELGLFFGHTIYAVSAVLTAFMGGLALGSYLGGRFLSRARSPLAAYGWLEIGIGAAGLLFWLLPSVLEPLYRVLYDSLATRFYLFNLARFAMATAILMIPTCLMGATLPVISAWRVDRGSLAPSVGTLYAANTFGATAGALAAGFILIERLGILETQLLAALVNGSIGMAAAWVGRRPFGSAGTAPAREQAAAVASADDSSDASLPELHAKADRLLLLVMGVSGFTALAYEVVWTRALVFHVGTTTHAFTSMLSVYLVGIAAGSLIGARLIERARHPGRLFGVLQIAIGLLCAGSLGVLAFAAPLIDERIQPDASWLSLLTSSLVKSGVTMALPTVLFGALFPVALRLTSASGSVAFRVGRFYAANTWGSLLGAAAAGFILIPLLGISRTLLVCASTNIALALIVLGGHKARPYAVDTQNPDAFDAHNTANRRGNPCGCPNRGFRPHSWLMLVAGAAAISLAAGLMAAPGRYLHHTQGSEQLVYYAEGNTATVSVVREVSGTKTLYIDKVPVAATDPIMLTDQKTLAHLPMLLHPDPRRVLTVGFGSGGASWSFARYDQLENVDCVEIDPAVFGAAPHLEESNHAVWRDPKFRLIIEDARSYLAYTKEQYDIISTDCTDLRYKTNANLYTTDYFGLCRRRLRPNGMVVVWMPLGGLDDDTFKMALRTFRHVFPHATLWYLSNYPTHYALLVGSLEPLRVDVAQVVRRLAETDVRQDLAEIGLESPAKLLTGLLLDERAYADFVGEGPLNSDRYPYLEFLAPRRAYRFALSQNLAALAARRSGIEPWLVNASEDSLDLSAALRRASSAAGALLAGHVIYQRGTYEYESALTEYRRAQALDPEDDSIPTLIDAVESTRAMWVREYETRTRASTTTFDERLTLARLYREKGQLGDSMRLLETLVEAAPNQAEARRELAATLSQVGNEDRAIAEYEHVLKLTPDSAEAHNDLGLLLLARRDVDRAAAHFEQAGRLDPRSAAAPYNMGLVHAARGDAGQAEAAYREALRRDPRLVEAWGNLAALLASTNRRTEAITALESLLAIDPTVEVARRLLEDLKSH